MKVGTCFAKQCALHFAWETWLFTPGQKCTSPVTLSEVTAAFWTGRRECSIQEKKINERLYLWFLPMPNHYFPLNWYLEMSFHALRFTCFASRYQFSLVLVSDINYLMGKLCFRKSFLSGLLCTWTGTKKITFGRSCLKYPVFKHQNC